MQISDPSPLLETYGKTRLPGTDRDDETHRILEKANRFLKPGVIHSSLNLQAMDRSDPHHTSRFPNDTWPDSQSMHEDDEYRMDSPGSLSSLTTQSNRDESLSRRRQRDRLSSVSTEESFPGTPDGSRRSSHIRYTMEWKFTVNGRSRAEYTEQDITLTPQRFWDTTLRSKLEAVVKQKLPTNNAFEVQDSKVIVSATGKRKYRTRFDGLDIDWAVLERQLRAWSDLLRLGKQLCINISFNYVKTTPPAVQPGRRITRPWTHQNAGSATELMLRELDEHQDALGNPVPWRIVSSLFRCPGPPCHVGPYCWLDGDTKKRYKLRKPHILRLIEYIQEGNKLENHDDVPSDVRQMLYMEDQQRLEQQAKTSQSRHAPINITNVLPASSTNGAIPVDPASQPPQLVTKQPRVQLGIPGALDDAVKRYCSYLAAKVTRTDLKEEYQKVCDVTIEEGLDLELVHEAQDPTFYTSRGIKIGVARRFVRDIIEWARTQGLGGDLLDE